MEGGRKEERERGREEFLHADTPGLQFSDLFSHLGSLLTILSDVVLILRRLHHMTFHQSHSIKEHT